jgi:transposase
MCPLGEGSSHRIGREGCGVGAAGAPDPTGVPGGRSRKTDMRAAMNAILYLLSTGCPVGDP